ncbi:MAG: FliH/SctL family protein [Clostridia bacterium]
MSKIHKSFEVVVTDSLPYIIREEETKVIRFPGDYGNHRPFLEEKMVEDEIEQAREKARQILEDAGRQAREIIEAARFTAKQEREHAFKEGYQEGREKGYREALQEKEREIAEARELRQQAMKERDEILLGMENEILELSLDIAEKILRLELDRNDRAFCALVANGLEKIRTGAEAILRVSPHEYELVCQAKDVILAHTKGIKGLDIVIDRFVEKGSCVIESANGTVDASIQTQLDKIKDSFLHLIGNER